MVELVFAGGEDGDAYAVGAGGLEGDLREVGHGGLMVSVVVVVRMGF